MDVLLKLGIVLLVGLLGGKIARFFKLPNVSGYLVFGLLLGPSFVKLISASDIEAFTVISELALGIIAFSIGSEFVVKEMKKLGKKSSSSLWQRLWGLFLSFSLSCTSFSSSLLLSA